MLDMVAIINQMLILFLCIMIGYAAQKAKILTEELQKGISKLVLYVTMPALILSSLTNGGSLPLPDVLFLLVVGFVMILSRLAFSFLMTKCMRVREEQRSAYHFMTAFSNLGFMGFPVAVAVFGPTSLFYAALFQIPFNLLSFTVGRRMLAGKKIEGPVWKVFLHPAILAALTTLILYLCRIELPAFITGTADMVGAITTPASMLVLGATLAGSPLKAVFSNWRLYVFCGITLIAMPLATYAMLLPFTDEVMILGVTTIMAALPGAASSAMQCHEYGGDADVCSAGVFLSTLCSLATIPLLMLMLFAH